MSILRFISTSLALFIGISRASAVILFATGDPAANTTEPTGALANSGWQYVGAFGPFAATAIDPHHFVTVKHIGTPSTVFTFHGVDYTIVSSFDDPHTELRIFEVAETLPMYAPLYSHSDELGKKFVVIGRGTQRGDAIFAGGQMRGWSWGAGDAVQRWGQNVVAMAYNGDLHATFDQDGVANEAHLSSGDSSGPLFINDNGVWKLAGVAYGVDSPVAVSPGGELVSAALFDQRGFYDSMGQLISAANPIPSGFFAVRISAELSWIQSVVPGVDVGASTVTAPSARKFGQIFSPAAGSVLPSDQVTFQWSATQARMFKLFVGNARGAADIYNSGKISANSLTVGNIPTNGVPIYVRLYSKLNRTWTFVDYTFTAYGGP